VTRADNKQKRVKMIETLSFLHSSSTKMFEIVIVKDNNDDTIKGHLNPTKKNILKSPSIITKLS
jgi:hypothetical protein